MWAKAGVDIVVLQDAQFMEAARDRVIKEYRIYGEERVWHGDMGMWRRRRRLPITMARW